MIIIGHKLVDFTPFYAVKRAEDIVKSPVIFEFDEENFAAFCVACKEKEIIFALKTNSLKEALIANAAGASYIVSNVKKAAKKIQRVAEHYLFDAKVLFLGDSITSAAYDGMDGILLPDGVIDGDI